MQNPHPFTKPLYVLFEILLATRLALRCSLPAIMLILALAIGTTFQPVVQAQDGGTRSGTNVRASFVLQVNTSDPKLRRICVGEKVAVPVTVALRTIELTGTGRVGDWIVQRVQLDPTVDDGSIVSAAQGSFSSSPAANTPLQTHLELTGKNTPGSTTITLNAAVQSDIAVFLDEDDEVGLPIPITSRADTISVPVRVIYCDFKVNISSIWDTSMHGARTLLIANAHNLRLIGGGLGPTLHFDPPDFGAPFLEWTWANNRIIGCLPSAGNFSTQAPRITGNLGENDITVTIDFARAVPGDGNSYYYRNLCLPHFSGEPCSDHPDGICFVMPVNRPIDWFEPQRLVLVFRLEGATQEARHLINHSWGSANGTTIITVAPIIPGTPPQ